MVARTRPDRSRAVDLVRVLALGAVVVGHWLKQGWYVDAAGGLNRAGLLGIATWTHPLTELPADDDAIPAQKSRSSAPLGISQKRP
jgi:hypothetical protein